MGRLLKRVPLTFKWPINKVWSGYVNPHARHACSECNGGGWSEDYTKLEKEWYGFENSDWQPNPFNPRLRYNRNAWNSNLDEDDVQALIEADRLWDFTRVSKTAEHQKVIDEKVASGGNSWLPFNNGYIPTPKEVNDRNLQGLGHDSINCSVVIKAKLKREAKSSICSACNGEGEIWQSPKAKSTYNNWQPYDPPTGVGYQLWENTSEGSPLTPVFDTLEALCEHCETEKVSAFGNSVMTKEEWLTRLSA